MTKNITQQHGPLCSAYETRKGAFNAEGDTPSFLHCIPTGLRNLESPDFGGWGGRYVLVRNNVWMDPLPDSTYRHPQGQWGFSNSWSKQLENDTSFKQRELRTRYFQPIWQWLDDVQNDFAARADWCVKDYSSANHPPVVRLKKNNLTVSAKPGASIHLDASASYDPDGNELSFRWWHYNEADSYPGKALNPINAAKSVLNVLTDAKEGQSIHIICEVTDSGTPVLTRYQRVIIRVKK